MSAVLFRSALSSLALLAASTMTSPAGELIQLVADLEATPRDDEFSANIAGEIDGVLYFSKDTRSYGQEIWKSDGTPEGTGLWADFTPGSDDGLSGGPVHQDGSHYFWARTIRNHIYPSLWKGDGTVAGSILLAENQPAAVLVPMGGKLYYRTGSGPARTDGTPEGTGRVHPSLPLYEMTGLTAIGGTLYFSASHNSRVGLWKSDGTAAGTVLVKELADYHNAPPFTFTEWNGGIYFRVSVGNYLGSQRQLWKTDGTTAGTVRVDTLPEGGGHIQDVVAAGGHLFYTTSKGELWKTDGTTAGAELLLDQLAFMPGADFQRMVGGALCFFTGTTGNIITLWRSDGTTAGTVPIGQFGRTTAYSHPPLMPYGGKLFFQLNGPSGEGLYATDGTAAGTVLVSGGQVLRDNNHYHNSYDYHVAPQGIFFKAAALRMEDGVEVEDFGFYLTDGTTAGTRLFVELETGTDSNQIETTVATGSHVYLTGSRDAAKIRKTWRTDGSAAGTVEMPFHIEGAEHLPASHSIAVNAGKLHFRGGRLDGDGNYHYGLMRHDDATGVTETLHSLPAPGPGGFTYLEFPYFTFMGDRTAFSAGGKVHVRDETTGVTTSLLDSTGANSLKTAGGRFFFAARMAAGQPFRIRQSDGTPVGTQLIPQDSSAGASYNQVPVGTSASRGELYFTEGGPYGSTSLHRTDGTSPGTVRLAWVNDSGAVHDAGGRMFFLASHANSGRELWTTDGTPAGTRMVKDITPGTGSTFEHDYMGHDLVVQSGKVYFVAATPSYGKGMWVSDGTEAGTFMVKDPVPGGTAFIQSMTRYNGKVAFTSQGGRPGGVLWETDGTVAGTRQLAAVTGDSASSDPYNLTAIGTDLYFVAHTEEYGRELLLYSPGTAAAPVVGQPTVSDVTKRAATVHAEVTPNRAATTAVLEYGTTPDYGSSRTIPLLPRDGRGPQPHALALQGLLPATTYHFRITATNAHGTDLSTSGTFTTPPNLPPVVQAPLRMEVAHETELPFPLETVLAAATDPDGDSGLIGISSMGSPASGTILPGGSGSFIYRPAAGFTGNDSLEITYADEEGAATSATLEFAVGGPFGAGIPNPPSVTLYDGIHGDVIHFSGSTVAGKSYLIQRSVDLVEWEDLETKTADGDGIEFWDESPPADQAFYRMKYLGTPDPGPED